MIINLRNTALAGMALAAVVAAGQQIPVTVNGDPVNFHGQGPVMRGDRVLVPLRGALERMGATVQWNAESRTVWAEGAGSKVKLRIGYRTALINGQPVHLDEPARIINGSTMVPLRFVGEALGDTVHWNARRQTVQIMTRNDNSMPTHVASADDGGIVPSTPISDQHTGRPITMSSGLTFPAGEVLRVGLNDPLSSANNDSGNRFMATVTGEGLPTDTHIEGTVVGVRAQTGDGPGIIEVRFDRIDLPDGNKYAIQGSLIDLDPRHVETRGNKMFASSGAPARMVIIGYGAGNGVIKGIASHGRVSDTAIKDLLSTNERDMETQDTPHNVQLDSGFLFGVRLTSPLTLKAEDVR